MVDYYSGAANAFGMSCQANLYYSFKYLKLPVVAVYCSLIWDSPLYVKN